MDPQAAAGTTLTLAAPPLARGWTPSVGHEHALIAGSPARAGMDPMTDQPPTTVDGLPRSRGDGPD